VNYASQELYLEALASRAVLPAGFSAATAALQFVPRERASAKPYTMNMTLIQADEPTSSFAGVFTRNAFPGAPVVVARKRLAEDRIRGIVVNNKIANVCAEDGEAAIDALLSAVAARAGGTPREYFSASTGIIGWRLPIEEMVAAVPRLVGAKRGDSALDAARSIMTTDAFPKVRAARVGDGRVVGIAKGAGMIEPNMATMLCFILCDCAVDRAVLREMLPRCAESSFNRISVDGDQSTSDMLIVLCSGKRRAVAPGDMESALLEVCRGLAEDVVRNGEGVGHVVRVTVTGAPDEAVARGAAKAIANSPLVKTAVFGNDPNVGRLVMALGDFLGNGGTRLDPSRVRLSMGGELVFVDGAFRLGPEVERKLAELLAARSIPTSGSRYPPHEECVDILVELGAGEARGEALGADLSYDYVKENADYRT
jgi:glutamate N-acetyltransferase / amino-acid N-acetyltransferase